VKSARRAAAERAVALLVRIPEAAARELYVQQAARRLNLTAVTLASDVATALRGLATGRPLRVRTPAVAAHPVADAGSPPPRAASWDAYLATLCVHRPEIAARLTGEFQLDVEAIQHPLARRMVEIALAAPPGETFPLTAAQQLTYDEWVANGPANVQDVVAGLMQPGAHDPADLRDQKFRPGLRVKRVQGHPGVWEMSWAADGRATFEYGEEIHGVIEWYDKYCLKVNRTDASNVLIYKPSIKYMYKESEAGQRR